MSTKRKLLVALYSAAATACFLAGFFFTRWHWQWVAFGDALVFVMCVACAAHLAGA